MYLYLSVGLFVGLCLSVPLLIYVWTSRQLSSR